ncbi:MAG: translation elongation factor Ts [Nitrospinae bacterium]|nr:translation elongation factor Ts [Nitrospinota bacterium]
MEITAEMVKNLREQSGAGIMDCKNALKEAQGDLESAITFLRKKGAAKAEKKLDRDTGEGKIGSYIHAGAKMGVLVQVNCETDFVANTPEFGELVKDMALHIAATNPKFVSKEEVTQEVLDKEREIFIHQAKESGKPEKVIEKIVNGKMNKFYEENCLLEQTFIKDRGITIQEMIRQKIASLGENITVGSISRMEIKK